MTEFSTLGLSAALLNSLNRLGFTNATPIQAAAIPLAVEGKDVLGTAQTGTGKTAAFGLPLIDHLCADEKARKALVITPTRELAAQVTKVLESFIDRKQKIRTALLIGGEPYNRQLQALSRNPGILIATPGRLIDHLDQGNLDLSGITYLVLDETDRMLDMGFSKQIDKVLKAMGQKRQTLLFSATLPPKIEALAKTYLQNPVRVSMGKSTATAKNVVQKTVFVDQREKFQALTKILKEHDGSALVFVRTKHGTERMAKALAKQGIASRALHGDLHQRKRDSVTRAFHKLDFRVLVATDVAARGLDIPHIALVINHDLPQVPEDYVHRIGRTARAGAKGLAFSFVSPAEKDLWGAITRMLKHDPSRSSQGRQLVAAELNSPGKGPRRNSRRKHWNPLESGAGSGVDTNRKPKKKKKGKGSSSKAVAPQSKKRARDQEARKNKGKPKWAAKGKQNTSA